jgi:hypothetical protein
MARPAAVAVALGGYGATIAANAAQPRRVAAKLGEYSIRLDRGSAPQGRVTFNTGRYVLCNLAGHHLGGMHASLRVR